MTDPRGESRSPGPTPGATPLDDDEREGLIPRHVATRGELDEVEHRNILEAERWLLSVRRRTEKVLDDAFVRALHKRMFGQTWRWAGKYRRSGKNIGQTAWEQVPARVEEALRNAKAQLAAGERSVDEIAARLHHALVWIHPFPNGNGRHARLLVDELLRSQARPRFTWGAASALAGDRVRAAYLHALREADAGRFDALMAFVRS